MRDIDDLFNALARSRFRRRFTLNERDRAYYHRNGHQLILAHGRDFVSQRLQPARPRRDGKQTPMKGHPFFVAQHATATCCRSCLSKWHGIPQGEELNEHHLSYILKVAGTWLAMDTLAADARVTDD